jgi:hypothetical protein
MQSTHVREIARVYVISFAFWFGISLLMGWQYRSIWSSYPELVAIAGSRAFSMALWTPPIIYLVRKYLGHARNRVRYVLLWGLGAIPFLLLLTTIEWALIPQYDDHHKYVAPSIHSWVEMIQGGFADQVFIYVAIVVAAHAYEYFQRARTRELEASEFQRALAVSELQTLKMQLHPHFLFNTLHGISTLIESDPARARAMLIKLSSLLRTALQPTDSDLIPLRDELKFIDEYLDLEKMRLGPRLTMKLQVDPDTLALLVPQLILQPLVENAVRHGIASSRDPGWIEITSTRANGNLELILRNSVGASRSPTDSGGRTRVSGLGVGLRNTASRVQLLYSGEASFSFTLADPNTAVARLRLPALGGQRQPESPERTSPIEAGVQEHASADRR